MTTIDDAALIDDNQYLFQELAAAGSSGCGIGSLSFAYQRRTGADLATADRAAEAFVAAALKRELIVEILGRPTSTAWRRFVLPQYALTSGQQRRHDLERLIAAGHSQASVAAAGFVRDAVIDAGLVGQSTTALLELLCATWPDMNQGEAIDYLTLWLERAVDAHAIYPHPRPPDTKTDWYISPDGFDVVHASAQCRTLLIQVAHPVGLVQLTQILTSAYQEAVRRAPAGDTLTSACVEITPEYVRVYDRPAQQD